MQSHRSWHSAFLFLASHQLCIWKEAMTTFAFLSISKRTRLPSGTTYSHHRFLLFEAQATVSGEQACTANVCFLSFFFHFLKTAENLCFTSASKFSVNRSSAGNFEKTRIWRSIFKSVSPTFISLCSILWIISYSDDSVRKLIHSNQNAFLFFDCDLLYFSCTRSTP